MCVSPSAWRRSEALAKHAKAKTTCHVRNWFLFELLLSTFSSVPLYNGALPIKIWFDLMQKRHIYFVLRTSHSTPIENETTSNKAKYQFNKKNVASRRNSLLLAWLDTKETTFFMEDLDGFSRTNVPVLQGTHWSRKHVPDSSSDTAELWTVQRLPCCAARRPAGVVVVVVVSRVDVKEERTAKENAWNTQEGTQ